MKKKKEEIQGVTGFVPGILLKSYRVFPYLPETSRYTLMLAYHRHHDDLSDQSDLSSSLHRRI